MQFKKVNFVLLCTFIQNMKEYLESIFALLSPYKTEVLNLDYNYISDETEDKFYHIEGLEDCFALRRLILSNHEITVIEKLEENIHLNYLDLSHNYIRKIENIAHLEKLSHLSLSYNDIRKTEGLHTLSLLAHLDLGHNKIKTIEGLQSLTQLKTLILSGNKAINTLSGLENQTLLEQLYVKQCKITDWSGLKYLKSLQELYASPVQISDMYEDLKELSLHTLHISNRELQKTDRIPHISTLRRLSITGCAFIQFVTGLEENPQLQELDLSNNTLLELNGIRHLTGLEVLDVRNNNLRVVQTEAIPETLKKIRMSGNPLTPDTLTNLQEWAKNQNIVLEL